MNSNLSFQIINSGLPKGWHWVKLGEVCKINPPRPKNFVRFPNAPTTFVPMAAVDEKTGTILNPEVVPYSKVFKGYTYFEENDVLFAKITPCMQNGKHVTARNLIDGIGFGTTEFHVLRPSNEILSGWIYFFIRQPHFLQEATAYFTGAVGQQRVPESFLSNYIIPLPPIEQQKYIVAKIQELMQEVERARTACEKQLEAGKALPAAYLRKVFESEEAKNWERKSLGEVCQINPARAKNFYRSPDSLTSFVPMVAVDEKTGTIFKPEVVPYSKVAKGYTYFEENDVLFAKITPCMQNGKHVIAKNLIDGIGFGSTEFHVLKPKNGVLSEWIWYFVRQPHFLEEATAYFTGAVGQQRVPDSFLADYIIPLPPIEVQQLIVAGLREKMTQVENLQSAIRNQQSALNALPQAILRKAFRGEL
jgi:type I restriction enzyme S subunit